MSKRPSRAKMCNWLADALRGIRTMPSNPADIGQIAKNARTAEGKLRDLSFITDNLGWHCDADLDLAWEEIQNYDKKWSAP